MTERVLQRSVKSGRGHIAIRRCVVDRVHQWPATMIRFVIGPDARVVPDVKAKLPGRGLWLNARREVLETAMARKVFAKVTRQPVIVPVDLADQVDDLLVRHVLDLIGLGMRARVVIFGYEKIVSDMKSGKILFLMEAYDGSSGKELRRLSDGLPVVKLFSIDALGAAVGRSEVVHVAVKTGHMAEVLLLEASRLARYRGLCEYV